MRAGALLALVLLAAALPAAAAARPAGDRADARAYVAALDAYVAAARRTLPELKRLAAPMESCPVKKQLEQSRDVGRALAVAFAGAYALLIDASRLLAAPTGAYAARLAAVHASDPALRAYAASVRREADGLAVLARHGTVDVCKAMLGALKASPSDTGAFGKLLDLTADEARALADLGAGEKSDTAAAQAVAKRLRALGIPPAQASRFAEPPLSSALKKP